MRAFWDPENPVLAAEVSFSLVDISKRYISALILAATLFMLMKSVGSVRAWVTGKRAGMAGKMAGTATKLAGGSVAIAGALSGNPAAAAVGAKVGQASAAAGRRISEGGTSGGSWIPQNSGGTFGRATAGRASGAGLLDKGMNQLKDISRDKQRLDRDKQLKDAVTGGKAGAGQGSGGSGGSGSGGSGPGGSEPETSNSSADMGGIMGGYKDGQVVGGLPDQQPPPLPAGYGHDGYADPSGAAPAPEAPLSRLGKLKNKVTGSEMGGHFSDGYKTLGKPITGPGRHLADKMGSVGSGAGASRASRAARAVVRTAATGRPISDPQGVGGKAMNALGMVLNPAGGAVHFAGKAAGKSKSLFSNK